MSKYSDTTNDDEAQCPYCGHKSYVESESYSEDTREEECSKCDKKYYLSQSFSVSHECQPDCELNGAQHQWEPYKFRDGRTHDFCAECGKCKPSSGEGEGK